MTTPTRFRSESARIPFASIEVRHSTSLHAARAVGPIHRYGLYRASRATMDGRYAASIGGGQ